MSERPENERLWRKLREMTCDEGADEIARMRRKARIEGWVIGAIHIADLGLPDDQQTPPTETDYKIAADEIDLRWVPEK
jgi:hypothetical protein